MALGPKRAQIEVPPTADIGAIIAALGPAATDAIYDGGMLRVRGITQAELEAAATPDRTDPIHGIRALKRQQARSELEKRVAAGMQWLGRPLQIDDLSTARITAATTAAIVGALPPGFAWRMADNTSLPLDNAGMQAMATAAFGYVFALRARYWQIMAALDAAPDVAAVMTVDPTAGWPTPPASPPPEA